MYLSQLFSIRSKISCLLHTRFLEFQLPTQVYVGHCHRHYYFNMYVFEVGKRWHSFVDDPCWNNCQYWKSSGCVNFCRLTGLENDSEYCPIFPSVLRLFFLIYNRIKCKLSLHLSKPYLRGSFITYLKSFSTFYCVCMVMRSIIQFHFSHWESSWGKTFYSLSSVLSLCEYLWSVPISWPLTYFFIYIELKFFTLHNIWYIWNYIYSYSVLLRSICWFFMVL
jgi:hypothetical protein